MLHFVHQFMPLFALRDQSQVRESYLPALLDSAECVIDIGQAFASRSSGPAGITLALLVVGVAVGVGAEPPFAVLAASASAQSLD